MRNTKQSTTAPNGEEALTLQQLMETMHVLQRKNEESRRQDQVF